MSQLLDLTAAERIIIADKNVESVRIGNNTVWNRPTLYTPWKEQRRNLILNPVGPILSGRMWGVAPQWFGTAGSGTTTDVNNAADGPQGITRYQRKTWTAKPTGTNVGAISFAFTGVRIPVTPGAVYAASAWQRTSWDAGAPLWNTVRFEFYTAATGGSAFSVINGANVPHAVSRWERLSAVVTVPATATHMNVVAMFQTGIEASGGYNPPVGATLDATGFLAELSATVGTYFDGSTVETTALEDYAWAGTVNASESVYKTREVQP